MKNFALVLALGLACAALVVAIGNAADVKNIKNDFADSVTVAEMCTAQVDPVFTTAEDVLLFKQNMLVKAHTDSIIMSLPDKTLGDVSTVCLKKKNRVKLKDIVAELRDNKDVYLNLPNTPIAPIQENAVVVETPPNNDSVPRPKLSSKTVTHSDTIINGTKFHIKKTIEAYEKEV
jgi:hypothetical protein